MVCRLPRAPIPTPIYANECLLRICQLHLLHKELYEFTNIRLGKAVRTHRHQQQHLLKAQLCHHTQCSLQILHWRHSKDKKMGIPGLFRICYYSLQLPNRASGKAKNKAGLEGWLEQGLEWAKGETPWMCMMVLTMPTHPKFTQCKSSTPCTKLAKHNFCWYWLLFSIFSLPLSISASCRQVRIKPHWTSSSTEYFVTKSQTQIICGWRSQPSLQSLQQFTFPKTSRTFSGTHLNLPNGWISILVCCVSPSKHRKQQPLWGTGSSSKS